MGVTSVMKEAGKAVIRAVGVEPDPGEMDLLDTLKAEHDEVKALLVKLQKAETAPQRKALVRSIRQALLPHAKAEEKILYAAIIALKDKDAQIDGHEGNIEHGLAAQTLQKLGSIANATSPEHKAAGKVLKELLEHHIREEESNVWSDAKDNFSDEERIAMNRRYLKAKAQVKVS
jgi:hemerythrin superfamily protein